MFVGKNTKVTPQVFVGKNTHLTPEEADDRDFEEAHGAWAAAMDDYNDRRKARQALAGKVSIARGRLEAMEERAGDLEGEEARALAELEKARRDMDEALVKLGPDRVWAAVNRLYAGRKPADPAPR